MSDRNDVHSAARVAATLRTLLAGFRQGGEKSVPVLVSEQDGGEPAAVLLPYELFQQMLQELEEREDRDIAALAEERIAQAPAPGDGLDTAALARMVEAGRLKGPDAGPRRD